MARVRILLAALLAASALLVVTGPATASVPAAKSKFCKAAEGIADSSTTQATDDPAAATKFFKQAAKHAPGKVKKAMKNVAKYLARVSDNPKDLAKAYKTDGFKQYAKSIATYVKYYSSHCSGSS